MNKAWWKAAMIRAVRTFFQAFLGIAGSAAVLSEIDWLQVLSASALAAILSLATSMTGLPEAEGETAE